MIGQVFVPALTPELSPLRFLLFPIKWTINELQFPEQPYSLTTTAQTPRLSVFLVFIAGNRIKAQCLQFLQTPNSTQESPDVSFLPHCIIPDLSPCLVCISIKAHYAPDTEAWMALPVPMTMASVGTAPRMSSRFSDSFSFLFFSFLFLRQGLST